MLVNEKAAKASYKVRVGDIIDVELPPPAITELIPEEIPFEIVFEDETILVVNKPAGLVVHPAAGIERGTLANGLVAHLGQFNTGGMPLRPGIVHRLDRDTSGLMVVAKNEQAHQKLNEQFAARTVEKHYTTLVYGRLKDKNGKIDLPIGRHPTQRTRMAVVPGRGRNALTFYHVQRQWNEVALLDVEIKTGRTHQIRVHLTHLHHPVVRDEFYAPGRANNIQSAPLKQAILRLQRQFLHAAQLAFVHPFSGDKMSFKSALPGDLMAVLNLLD